MENNIQDGQDEDNVISLDDLDSLLANEDPVFAENMQKMAEDEDLRKADVEVVDFEETEDSAEIVRPSTLLERHPRLNQVVRPILQWRQRMGERYRLFIINRQQKIIGCLHWFKKDFPLFAKEQWQKAVVFYKKTAGYIKSRKDQYKALSKKQKWGIHLSILFAIAVVSLILFTRQASWLPVINEPFYPSLVEFAEKSQTLTGPKDLKSLYRAFPQPEHIVQLNKLVVNLKRENSDSVPMAAMEFYLELDSKETAIEIKDREKQVLDVIQRAVEEFTYSELNSAAGVVKMKSLVRSEVNNLLNQGRVTKVYQKTMILKP